MIKKVLNIALNFSLLVFFSGVAPLITQAASVTSFSDTMSTQATSATAIHTVAWTLVTADTVATGETYAIDYVNADFTLNAIGNWQTTDFSLNDGTARGNPVAVGAAPACSAGANNYTVTIDVTNVTFTITTCASWTASGATPTVTLTINGTTATGTGTMTNKSSDVNSSLVALTQSNGDSGNSAVVVETNDVVTVTATVNPVLTFAISSATVAFGTVVTGTASTGTHTISAATNATGGFTVTYIGATLTSGGNTITSAGTLAASNTAIEQFGLNLKANTTPSVGTAVTTNAGTCGIATNYNTVNSFSFAVSTTTPVTAVTAPADCVYTAAYLANVSSVTEAGAYSTTLTWIASGSF